MSCQMRIVSEMQKQHGAMQQPGQQPPPMPTGPGPYMGQARLSFMYGFCYHFSNLLFKHTQQPNALCG